MLPNSNPSAKIFQLVN